jgi:aarF domain-containing kinase
MSDTTSSTKSKQLYKRYGAAAKMRRLARKAAVAKRGKAGSAARKNPVDAWPGSLMFFFRTTGLLRGLCSALGVEQRYLAIMAAAARRALITHYVGTFQAGSPPPPVLLPGHDSGGGGGRHAELQRRLGELMIELHGAGELVGAQVCVYHEGVECASVCCGTLGKVDRRPVQPDTLFNCFSVTKGVLATAFHMLIERSAAAAAAAVEYSDPVSALWPEFACAGKERCTLKHVLCHQAGLQHALPPDMGLSTFADFEACAAHLEAVAPLWAPESEKVAYHYYTFGWLVGELLRRADARVAPGGGGSSQVGQDQGGAVAKRGVDEIVRELIAQPLGLEREFMIGIGAQLRSEEAQMAVADGETNAAAAAVSGGGGDAGQLPLRRRLATLSSSMVAGRNAASRAEVSRPSHTTTMHEGLWGRGDMNTLTRLWGRGYINTLY